MGDGVRFHISHHYREDARALSTAIELMADARLAQDVLPQRSVFSLIVAFLIVGRCGAIIRSCRR